MHVQDTDQTDYEPPLGRGVWIGVAVTVVLIIAGIWMMMLLFRQDEAEMGRDRTFESNRSPHSQEWRQRY